MTKWVKLSDRAPEVVMQADGGCDSVLVYYKVHIESGSQFQVSSTAYLNNPVSLGYISHWMPLPDQPE